MKYKFNTETERVNDAVSKQGVGFSLDEFEPHASFGHLSMASTGGWRSMSPEKWRAGKMKLTTAPQQGIGNLLNGVSGKPNGSTVKIDMEYAEAQREIVCDEIREKQVGPLWQGTLSRGKFDREPGGIGSRLVQSVNPTHSKSGLPLPANASRQNPWSSKRTFGQSIRSIPSQILS
jgi:hypothetical protein